MAWAAIGSKAVVLLLLIYCLMHSPLFVRVLCLSFLVMHYLLCVYFSFAIILKRKRKLNALLSLSYRCIYIINVLWLFFSVLLVGLQCVIDVFPDHTHLLFYNVFRQMVMKLTQSCLMAISVLHCIMHVQIKHLIYK